MTFKPSTEELRRHLLTTDGRGKEYKENALNELLRREWWKFWKWLVWRK